MQVGSSKPAKPKQKEEGGEAAAAVAEWGGRLIRGSNKGVYIQPRLKKRLGGLEKKRFGLKKYVGGLDKYPAHYTYIIVVCKNPDESVASLPQNILYCLIYSSRP